MMSTGGPQNQFGVPAPPPQPGQMSQTGPPNFFPSGSANQFGPPQPGMMPQTGKSSQIGGPPNQQNQFGVPAPPPQPGQMSQTGPPNFFPSGSPNQFGPSQPGMMPQTGQPPQLGGPPNQQNQFGVPAPPPQPGQMSQTGPPNFYANGSANQFGPPQLGMMPQTGQPPQLGGPPNQQNQFGVPAPPPQPGQMSQTGPPNFFPSGSANQFGPPQPGMMPQTGKSSQIGGPPNQQNQFGVPAPPPQPGQMSQTGPPNFFPSGSPNQFGPSQPGMMPQTGQPPQLGGPPNQQNQFGVPAPPPQPGQMSQTGPPNFYANGSANQFGPPQLGMMPQTGQPPQLGPMISSTNQFGVMPPQPGNFMPPHPGMMPSADAQRNLDPNTLPSVIQVIEDDKQSRSGAFPTGYPTAELPPLVTTNFFAQDQGNCNPKFVRSTVYAVPQSQDMLKNFNLPISLSIEPFSELSEQECLPPVVDLGEMGPVRCQRCKAYMCSFMEFIDGGRKFRCPFCKSVTSVADSYFAHLDHTGRRTDISYRPELCLGSYEFVATNEYCKNGVRPKEPAFIFMLDVSYNAVRNGLLELFCRNIIDLLRNLPKDYGMDKSVMKVGLATYDNVIHFYKLGENGARPCMLVVQDVVDIFAPLAEEFLVNFEQAEASMISCLREIVRNFSDTRITDTILGPVMQAGLDALKSVDRVGKLFIFHTSLPTLECPGQLKNREDRQVLGTDKEKNVLTPATDFYTKLGEKCVKFGCSIDLFLFPNSFIDVASIAPAVTLSGGTIYKYQYFDHSVDGKRFLHDLKRCISRPIVFDVMMRVRTSTGIRPTGFYGSFYMQNTTDIEVAAIDSDKAVQVEMKYDDKLDDKEPAFFQTAILFTSCGGQRRLRIHNLALTVSSSFNVIYRLPDEGAVITHLFKNAERSLRDKSPKEMRDDLITACTHILATYREKCGKDQPKSQLILPECLKLLPIHVNCMLKNDALNGGSELNVDDRAWMMSLIPSMTVKEVWNFLYPRILPITQLGIQNGENDQTDEAQSLPLIRASIDFFKPEEAFLIDNGLVSFIWVGQNVPANWLRDIFNVNAIQHLDSEQHELPENENSASQALRRLIDNLNAHRTRRAKLFIIKQHDGLESWMKKFLVEDRYAANTTTYVDFLCLIHREIANLLT